MGVRYVQLFSMRRLGRPLREWSYMIKFERNGNPGKKIRAVAAAAVIGTAGIAHADDSPKPEVTNEQSHGDIKKESRDLIADIWAQGPLPPVEQEDLRDELTKLLEERGKTLSKVQRFIENAKAQSAQASRKISLQETLETIMAESILRAQKDVALEAYRDLRNIQQYFEHNKGTIRAFDEAFLIPSDFNKEFVSELDHLGTMIDITNRLLKTEQSIERIDSILNEFHRTITALNVLMHRIAITRTET